MSLYLGHFGLREPPFRITPDTDYFFTGANRGPTLDALIFAITQDEGIVKVTGEVGSGKTMLCRMLLERLPENIETLYLANPSLSRQEILGAIADELGIPTDGKATHSLTRAIQDALIDRYAKGKRVVILIDEAHAMPPESLEEIRLLSNLESKATKLLQIALFAQPELEEHLAANDMRQLRERITQHFSLGPLKPQEIEAYLEFRLRTAGYKGPPPFSQAAIAAIAKISEGLSRRVNILADKSMLAAYAKAAYLVGPEEIALATRDARFSPLQPKRPRKLAPLIWLVVGVSVAGAGIAAFVSNATRVQALPPLEPTKPIAQTPKTLPPDVAATPAPMTQTAPVAEPSPAPPEPHLAENHQPPAATPPVSNDRLRFGPLTQKHLATYDQWIQGVADDRFFIQLLISEANQTQEIEAFFAQAIPLLDTEKLHAYQSSLSGKDRLGIIYGEYPSREAAISEINRLPASIKSSSPFARQVSKLR